MKQTQGSQQCKWLLRSNMTLEVYFAFTIRCFSSHALFTVSFFNQSSVQSSPSYQVILVFLKEHLKKKKSTAQ